MSWWRLPSFGRTLHPASAPSPTVVDINELPVNDEGVPILNLERIHRVGIVNLATVAENHIEQRFGSISHHLRLVNGGTIRFAYALGGKLLELSGERVLIAVAEESGSILFDVMPDAQD